MWSHVLSAHQPLQEPTSSCRRPVPAKSPPRGSSAALPNAVVLVGSGPIAGWMLRLPPHRESWGPAGLAGVPFPAHGLCPSPKAGQYLWDMVGGPSTPLGVPSAALPPEGLGTEESPPFHGPRKCLIPAPAQPALPGSSDTDVLMPWLQGP